MKHRLIFIAGLHRSGTSLLHSILRDHPQISGFRNTGVPEDEGQHLQNIYQAAIKFGGPGRFAFDPRAYMDETHPLATSENALRLFEQWSAHWDLSKPYLIEKSPPTIIRTRFFQKLFPGSRFIVIFRHPVAVAYATQKWCDTGIESLVDHTLHAYEIFMKDCPYLESVCLLRYEDLIADPKKELERIYRFLELDPVSPEQEIRDDINRKYFERWKEDRTGRLAEDWIAPLEKYDRRSQAFGYRIAKEPETLMWDTIQCRKMKGKNE